MSIFYFHCTLANLHLNLCCGHCLWSLLNCTNRPSQKMPEHRAEYTGLHYNIVSPWRNQKFEGAGVSRDLGPTDHPVSDGLTAEGASSPQVAWYMITGGGRHPLPWRGFNGITHEKILKFCFRNSAFSCNCSEPWMIHCTFLFFKPCRLCF